MLGLRVLGHGVPACGRARVAAVALLCALALTTPPPMLAAATGATGDELGQARSELDVASRDLGELQAEIRRVGTAVAEADERLRTAATSLRSVEADLADAEEAAAAAAATERAAAATLATASAELDGLQQQHRDGRDRLAAQAVVTYKRGTHPATELAFSGVVRADDWHEVAVTRGVLQRLLDEQQTSVDDDAERTRDTARANAAVGDLRRQAVAAARDADAERVRVASLVTERQQLVDTVAQEREARTAVLRRLEDDASARAVLVTELERQVAALERSAAAVTFPPQAVPDDGPPPAWAAALPAAGRPWAATIDAAARRQGVDGRLLAALVWSESMFRPDVVSHAGAIGLAQLMPGTARGLGVDPWDPTANLTGGARYLRTQLDTFGRIDLALAAYNAGPGRVRGGQIPRIVETQLYVVTVLERHERLVAATP